MFKNKYTTKFHTQFKNPVELLHFYDKSFLDNLHKLYPWQVEILMQFSADLPSSDSMSRLAVIAANGSGKTQYVLCPAVNWVAVAFEKSLSYVTSSSALQLNTQTERCIDDFAAKMNEVEKNICGAEVWNLVQRRKTFLPNNSFIDLFATDEPKRAEGKHPLVPNGEFAIFVDEGKSIKEEIYSAIDRCTGATRRLDISSAGGCHGHFYEVCTRAELAWKTWKITYKDCPHIKETEFNQQVTKHGLHDPLVRSIFFSEFTDIEDSLVIRRESLVKCKDMFSIKQLVKFGPSRRAGLDLSGGGDEMCLSIWEGNVQIGQETARFYDTSKSVYEIINWVQKWKLESHNVWVEYDGFNRGIVGHLDDKGYHFNRVLSGGKASDSKRYANRMTELWFKVKRYVEEGYIKFYPDTLIESQLTNRYYRRQAGTDKIILERKEEAKKKGHPSPDRADAAMFAWATMPNIEEFLDSYIEKSNTNTRTRYGKIVEERELFAYEDILQASEENFFSSNNKKHTLVNGSMDCLISDSDNNVDFEVNFGA